MKNLDLDREFVDLLCFFVAAGLVVFAQFRPDTSDKVYEFATLAAGSALRGLGTSIKKNQEDSHGTDD